MRFVLFFLLFVSFSAQAIDISDIHHNNSSGVPTMLDQTVTVTGVVTVPSSLLDTYHLEAYVQDATGGINIWVYAGNSSYPLTLGDSVTVTSRVKQYNGMTELGTSSSYTSITNNGPGVLPEPLLITCAELEGSFHGDYSEPHEGRLVKLENLTITSGTWPESPSSSNVILYVSDGTDTAKIYIDKDTQVDGTPHPGTGFSLVGIIKQYDSSSPYTTGYELIPRFPEDVIVDSVTELAGGVVRNVTQSSAAVLFETINPGSSEVEYGLTDSYGSTAGNSGANETSHFVELDNLLPNKVYHYRVKSDASVGPDQRLATASDQPGEIDIFMNGSAETQHAGYSFDQVSWNQILSAKLSILINSAEASVDASLYSFSIDNVKNALIAAHNRGCDVRIIIDQNNSTYAADQCAAAGIPYIQSNQSYGYMHNKFVVIDARDEDPYNDVTWTGSANMSLSGNDDINNAIQIRDYGLAQAYTIEFEEMWSGLFGDAKTDNTPHEFTINGIRIEQYMSPSDNVTAKIIDAVNSADNHLFLSILAFTHNDISAAMESRQYYHGVDIRAVFDDDQDCSGGSEYFALAGDPCAYNAWSTPADVWLDTALSSDVYLHHKYMIVDPLVGCLSREESDPLVFTGSHNWSYSAESSNDENSLILHDANIANQYVQEFAARYHESGGQSEEFGECDASAVDTPSLTLSLSCYPNPFNPMTRISFSTAENSVVDLAVFNSRGELVATLMSKEQTAPGLHIVGWNGLDSLGKPVASGVYSVKVSTEKQSSTQQITLVR